MDSQALRLRQWKAGRKPGPWRVYVFPTYRCNLRCMICARNWQKDPLANAEELSDDRWLRLVDEGADLGVREWFIGGGGEPLLRGDLVMAMCARIRERGMNGVLQTNGTQFTPAQLEQLVDMAWDAVHISLDGPTAEINDAIRFKGAFDKATAALRSLAAIKKERAVRYPRVCVTMVKTAANCAELDNMIALCAEMGVERLQVNDLILYGDAMSGVAPTEEQEAAFREAVAPARVRAQELGIETNLDRYLPTTEPGPANRPAEAPGTLMCIEPWLSVVFVSSGVASPCCVFGEQEADSIRDKSLREVWLGPYLETLRREFTDGRFKPACMDCPQLVAHPEGAFSLSPANLVRKGLSSLRRYGLRQSLRRGREWLVIRAGVSSRAKTRD